MKWESIELLGYTHYSEKGYRILVPLVSNHGYDFVAQKDDRFLKVNVKVATRKSPRENSWSISMAGGPRNCSIVDRKQNLDIDKYLVWLPTQERFIELPGDFLSYCKSQNRCIPVALI